MKKNSKPRGPAPRKITWEEDVSNCHICTSHKPTVSGYYHVKRKGKTFKIHRLMYEKKNGKIPTGKIIRHTCDNNLCINPDHLLIGTYKDNSNDMVERNRQAKGTKIGKSKLTDEDVRNIYKDQRAYIVIAKEYGLTGEGIAAIKHGKVWKHVTKDMHKKWNILNKEKINKNKNINPMAVLTPTQVTEIYLSDLKYSELVKIYGIGKGAISAIKNDRTWKSITKNLKK